MSEYLIQDSTLTAISDAIRSKSGKNNEIFVSDMPAEINNIPSLNFKVVGGTTQPENPKENTIWVNTDLEISMWTFDSVVPNYIKTYGVWFKILTPNNIVFNALNHENRIMIYPISAAQYNGSEFMTKKMKIYMNGEWNNGFCNLYNYGDTCSEITGGYKCVALPLNSSVLGSNAPIVTYNDSYMNIVQNGAGKNGIVCTNKKVNLSGFSTLNFIGKMYAYDQSWRCAVYIWNEIGTYATDNAVSSTYSDGVFGTKSIDITWANGDYYIGFNLYSEVGQNSSYVDMNRLWLE